MKPGQKIGLSDQLLRDICVGDEVIDAKGVHYTIDRYGRAKPTDGGNEVPVRSLTGCEVTKAYLPSLGGTVPAPKPTEPTPQEDEETRNLRAIQEGVAAAGDQTLVDELRKRGWTVVCTQIVEKVVFEEVSL